MRLWSSIQRTSAVAPMFALVACASAPAALLFLFVAGCASAPATPEPQSKVANAGIEPCATLAQKLCEELGPSSDSCRMTKGVVTFLPDRACEEGIANFADSQKRVRELRASCESLAVAVCTELGEDSESCVALRADLPNIPPGHCAALLHDQDQIIAALKTREALDEPVTEERWRALTTAPGPSFGAPDARVTIVEFSDFQCPYCAEAARTLRKLKETHGASVRVIFRHYPLPFHERAQAAAQAAAAAHAQNKFWEYHDMLFENQGALDAQALETYAERLKLDVAKFREASVDGAVANLVTSDVALGDSVNVRGTPTVFVNGKRLANGVDYDAVSAAVNEALAAQ
jgi:protein-disulfide isomerase